MQTETKHIANKSQKELVAALKANNESVMKELYRANYKKVEAWVLQNSGSVHQAKDVYQEAFIAVWRNVRTDRFTPASDSSLNGYLYCIAKNKWLDYLRSAHHKKTVSECGLQIVSLTDDAENETNKLKEHQLKIVMTAFEKLGEQCKMLLDEFYFKHKKYDEIAGALNMKEASVRNQKYRCMQKLRKLSHNLQKK